MYGQWWILGEANEAVASGPPFFWEPPSILRAPPRKQHIQFWIHCRCLLRGRFGVKDSRKVVSIDRIAPVILPVNKNPSSIAELVADSNENLRNRYGRCVKMPSKYNNFLLLG